jgi:hypothetical protein
MPTAHTVALNTADNWTLETMTTHPYLTSFVETCGLNAAYPNDLS